MKFKFEAIRMIWTIVFVTTITWCLVVSLCNETLQTHEHDGTTRQHNDKISTVQMQKVRPAHGTSDKTTNISELANYLRTNTYLHNREIEHIFIFITQTTMLRYGIKPMFSTKMRLSFPTEGMNMIDTNSFTDFAYQKYTYIHRLHVVYS